MRFRRFLFLFLITAILIAFTVNSRTVLAVDSPEPDNPEEPISYPEGIGFPGKDSVDSTGFGWIEKKPPPHETTPQFTSIPNPAAVYCADVMGYEYQTISGDKGEQVGTCIMPDGQSCDQWDFYAGLCGEEYSYCASNGYGLQTMYDGDDPYAPTYAVCTNQIERSSNPAFKISDLLELPAGNHDLEPSTQPAVPQADPIIDAAVPTSWDWRSYNGYNWLSPVRNQGYVCGSCWTFASTGVTEAHYNILSGNPTLDLDLSEQDSLSCSNSGSCTGGSTIGALIYTRDVGVVDEACMPYTESDSSCTKCGDWASRLTSIDELYYTYNPDAAWIKEKLVEYGPVYVSMGVNSEYGGYFDGDVYRCSDDSGTNHAVVIAGYNDAGGYWIVRNSWGSTWNGDGYFKVGYGECAIDSTAAGYASEATPISNDNMSGAIDVSSTPYSNQQYTTTATLEAGEPSYSCGDGVGNTVWYSYTASSSGDLLIDTYGSDFDTVLHVYEDNGGSLSQVGCNDDDSTGYGTTSRLLAPITSGKTYLISVGGYYGDNGMLSIAIDSIDAFTSCSAVDVPTSECNALYSLYTNTNGGYWYSHGGWFNNESVCTWDGIGCWNGHVDTIMLNRNNLSGSLTTDFTNLPYLWNLELFGNQLSGNWVTIVDNLPTTLGYLSLGANQFTGTIPSMSSFDYLTGLNLASSSLTGDMSTITSKLPTSLEYLNLEYNQFEGTIPSMSSFTYLSSLYVSNNNFSGPLSTVISNLPTSISYLSLRENGFTGTVPSSIGALTNIWALDLSENELTGDLSTAIGYIDTELGYLYLDGNNFTGTIPSSISNFIYLYGLYIDNNRSLSGTIPVEIANVTSLDYFSFHNTNLCAPVSSAYDTWAGNLYYYDPAICGAPTGLFTDPIGRGTVMVPRTWLNVEASDVDGDVASVGFWAYFDGGWHMLGTDTNGADGWQYQWDTSGIGAQTVHVQAVLTDNDGKSTYIFSYNISTTDTITFGDGYETRGSRTEDVENAQTEICEVEQLEVIDVALIDTLQIFEPLSDPGAHVQQPH